MSVKETLHHLIDSLPEGEEHIAQRFLEYLIGMRHEAVPSDQDREEQRAKVMAVAGKYSWVPTSVEKFCQQKQQEIDLEDAIAERRRGADGQ